MRFELASGTFALSLTNWISQTRALGAVTFEYHCVAMLPFIVLRNLILVVLLSIPTCEFRVSSACVNVGQWQPGSYINVSTYVNAAYGIRIVRFSSGVGVGSGWFMRWPHQSFSRFMRVRIYDACLKLDCCSAYLCLFWRIQLRGWLSISGYVSGTCLWSFEMDSCY